MCEHPHRAQAGRVLLETLKSPATYVGAAVVGGISLMTTDLRFGWIVPFLVPIFVQAFARMLASRSVYDQRTQSADSEAS